MLVFPALLLATALASTPRETIDAPAPLVTWQELCDRPSRWLGKPVRLRVQFQGRVESWNPYLTRFGTKRFASIQAWSDEQFPWNQPDFDAPLVRLFLPRGEACAWALDRAAQGARFEVSAVVREVFLDVPWTEIREVLPLPEHIGEGTVIHASKAVDLMKKRSWTLAELEIQQAITDSLPAQAREELGRLRTECRDRAAADKLPKRSNIEVRRPD
jgi:hypothetical protein